MVACVRTSLGHCHVNTCGTRCSAPAELCWRLQVLPALTTQLGPHSSIAPVHSAAGRWGGGWAFSSTRLELGPQWYIRNHPAFLLVKTICRCHFSARITTGITPAKGFLLQWGHFFSTLGLLGRPRQHPTLYSGAGNSPLVQRGGQPLSTVYDIQSGLASQCIPASPL